MIRDQKPLLQQSKIRFLRGKGVLQILVSSSTFELNIVYPAPTSCFKWLPDHRSSFITFTVHRKTQVLIICVQSHSADNFWLNYIMPCAEKCQYMSFWCMIWEYNKQGWNFSHSGVEWYFSHSAEFESHLPNTVKTSAMDVNFVVAHDIGLLKSQIYLYVHSTCTATFLPFYFEEILCVTLAIQ